jgi:hypothetical protein
MEPVSKPTHRSLSAAYNPEVTALPIPLRMNATQEPMSEPCFVFLPAASRWFGLFEPFFVQRRLTGAAPVPMRYSEAPMRRN